MSDEHQDFLELTLQHLDVVWSVARRMTDRTQDAEDLVQETYLRAFQSFDRFRGGDARSWLVSICLNTARSLGRRKQRRPREVHDVDLEVSSPDDVSSEAMRTLDREAISRALAEIPEPQRIAIVLVDMAGFTARQAAECLGAPRGTILARVHRGRRKLAQLLEDLVIEDV